MVTGSRATSGKGREKGRHLQGSALAGGDLTSRGKLTESVFTRETGMSNPRTRAPFLPSDGGYTRELEIWKTGKQDVAANGL